jgi:hypothetical protein
VLQGVARSPDFRWTLVDWSPDESPDLLDFALAIFAGCPPQSARVQRLGGQLAVRLLVHGSPSIDCLPHSGLMWPSRN